MNTLFLRIIVKQTARILIEATVMHDYATRFWER